MFTDTHCHFEKQYYDDYDLIIKNAESVGVTRLFASGCSTDANFETSRLSEKYNSVYSTIGLHPDQASIYSEDDLNIIHSLINKNSKVIGIGEIGLDYHYEGFDREKQINLFEKQLNIAEIYSLPVVIHSRDATQDTIDILKKHHVKGIIHSFSGSLEVAKIYLSMGFKLGINGVVTFKNCNLKDVLQKLSPNDIVLETDSPYLTPHPFRGQKNESKNIILIAEYVSEIFGISLEKFSEITNKNVSEIFDI